MKMKQIAIAIVALAAIVVGIMQMKGGVKEIASSGVPSIADARQLAQAASANLTPFVSEAHGIALQYPGDWSTEEPAEGPMLFRFQTLSGVVNATVMSQDVEPGTTLEDYVQLNVDQTQSFLTEKNMSPELLDRHPVQVDGQPGVQLTYGIVQPESALPIKVTQTFVLHDGHAYAISFTTPSAMHGEFAGLIGAIRSSIRFPEH